MTLSCLCGSVLVRTSRDPEHINECNCKLCSGTGARWAYFHPAEVTVDGDTTGFTRTDKAEPAAQIRFCPTCGSTTHFVLTEAAVAAHGNVTMGVNMRLADEADLSGVELRYPDGRNWSGDGPFGHAREPRVIGR